MILVIFEDIGKLFISDCDLLKTLLMPLCGSFSFFDFSSFVAFFLFSSDVHSLFVVFRSNRTWTELKESEVFELCLLRWETQIQLEMGNSIRELVKGLGSTAVQNVLAATVLTAVASAVLFPVLLVRSAFYVLFFCSSDHIVAFFYFVFASVRFPFIFFFFLSFYSCCWVSFQMQLTSVIDNSWVLAVETADAAGKELAQALLNRSSGMRPVTLVGFSFGARVIYSCLRELAVQTGELDERVVEAELSEEKTGTLPEAEETVSESRKEEQAIRESDSERGSGLLSSSQKAAGSVKGEKESTATTVPKLSKLEVKSLIQDVVLLGAPINSKSRSWKSIRSIVSGRVINGYSQLDLVLGLVYR
jgi:hypothetical protein